MKPKLFESRPEANAPHVYVCAWALCCIHSLTSTQTFQRVLTALVDSCTGVKSGITNSGSLEEGAGKRCLECGPSYDLHALAKTGPFYLPPCLQGWDMTSTLLLKLDHFICHHVYRAEIWPSPSSKKRTIFSATMSAGLRYDLHPLAKNGPFYLPPCLQGWNMTSTLLWTPNPWSVTIIIYCRAEIYLIYKLYCAAGTKLFHLSPSLKVRHLSWCRATDHAIFLSCLLCDPNT